jgi:hypothetical protein
MIIAYSGKQLQAKLKYLGEFSDPIKVRQYLALTEKQDTEKYDVELKSVEKRLPELELQFLNQLDGLLRRMVLTDQEFAKANEKARIGKSGFGSSKVRTDQIIIYNLGQRRSD